MKTRNTVLALAVTFLLLLGLFFGQRAWTERARGNPQAVPLDRMELPSGVATAKVVAVGEATHGNKEFYDVKRAVVEQLVTRHGYRVVALEADFGATQAVDRYVRAGQGTAEDAARALGFTVYANRQMAELLRWIHDYNTGKQAADQVHVMGFDMQRYDASKAMLAGYLDTVDPDLAARVRADLGPLTDDTIQGGSSEKYKAAGPKIKAILDRVAAKRAEYTAKSDPDRYDMAHRTATVLDQGVRARAADDNRYAVIRDEAMADNLTWIVDREVRRGARPHVVVSGHNGHIDKTGAALAKTGTRAMGVYLAERFGKDYVAIGTDFGTSRFNSGIRENRGEYQVSVKAPYRGMFDGTEVGYMDFARVDATNRTLVDSTQPMGSAGESFVGYMAYLDSLHETPTVPAKAYDAVVYVQPATPIEML